jgi:hypothetical protein
MAKTRDFINIISVHIIRAMKRGVLRFRAFVHCGNDAGLVFEAAPASPASSPPLSGKEWKRVR